MSDITPDDAATRRSTHIPPADGETLPPVVPPRPPLPDSSPSVVESPADDSPRRRWLLPVAVGLVCLIVGVVAGSLVTGAVIDAQHEAAERAASEAAEAAKSSLFEDVARECRVVSVVEIADESHTLIVDGKGEDFGSGDVTFTGLDCIIDGVGAPTAVRQQMLETRSLDGRQSAEWDDLSASWSYHPDDGLDIIFELDD